MISPQCFYPCVGTMCSKSLNSGHQLGPTLSVTASSIYSTTVRTSKPCPVRTMSSRGHHHNPLAGTQNQGNSLGDRSCIRQSKLFRQYESGNGVKGLLGASHLAWNTDMQEGAYAGRKVYDHNREHRAGAGHSDGGSVTPRDTTVRGSQSTAHQPERGPCGLK
jgi:hypothetical protein